MMLTISGIDKISGDAWEYFTIDVDLMKDEFKIYHKEDYVQIYVDTEDDYHYFVSSREDLEISNI